MTLSSNPAHQLQVLRYWWMLELFSPQRLPALTRRADRPEDHQVIEWQPSQSLPWNYLQVPQPRGQGRRRWRHTIYLGVYELEATYQYLHRVFADDHDAYDERNGGVSACAVVVLDEHGALTANSALLSSALWAVAKVSFDSEVPNLHWASQFNWACEHFKQDVDAWEGLRREQVHASAPLPQDSKSLTALLDLARRAAGVTGMPGLDTGRIVISSTAVSEKAGDDVAAGADFLNSFFLDDLARVQQSVAAGACPPALDTYLREDTAPSERIDVMVDNAAVDAGVSLDRLPPGRWPADPAHGLALRQQFAVNQALNDLASTEGLMGVNGPPGTGKTTMLRDVLAGNVVERARRLAALNHPREAFTGKLLRWTNADSFDREVHQLRPELTGFEMVVAAANNGAAENISVELPDRQALGKRWRQDADYFARLASATLPAKAVRGAAKAGAPDTRAPAHTAASPAIPAAPTSPPTQAWGLVAACLGSKRNRGAFYSAFWFDSKDPHSGEPVPHMQSLLKQWASGEVPPRNWAEARTAFRQAEQRVEALKQQRQEAQTRLGRLKHVLGEQDRFAETVERAEQALRDALASKTGYEPQLKAAQAAREDALEVRRRLLEVKPGALETLFTFGRAARRWRTDFEPAEETLAATERQWTEATARGRELAQAVEQRRSREEAARAALAANTQEVTELLGQVAQDREAFQPGYPDQNWSGELRELHAPWLDEQLDTARSELFLAALRLHQDFLANAASQMLPSLRAAIEVVAGQRPHDLESEKLLAAWQVFFLTVPLVSTTFASFGRMFAGLGPQALGWLLIDEAGQAAPQYAVGAIWRSRRVLAVGDPLQLQPVVTMPRKAQRDLATAGRVGAEWIPPLASVQTLADRSSRYGTLLAQGEEDMWVSAPLTVHRRCDEPMFGLCNELAYGGMMVSGVQRALAGVGPGDQFDSPQGPVVPTSRWIHVPATQPGKHLQANEIEVLRRCLQGLGRQGVAFSQVIAVSPFRSVAQALAALGRTHPGLRAGTIHTAQGREADVVLLVLGGDPAAPGAKAWASASVNLVNVAASRAKRRLYVIGDRESWSKYRYFKELAVALG